MSEPASGEQATGLHRLAAAVAEAHKRSPTKAAVQEAVDLLADELRARLTTPGELLRMEGMSARVAGPGLAKAWGQMDEQWRKEALVALEHAEKPLRTKALVTLAEGVFAEDPEAAVRVLSLVLTSKELKTAA